MASQFTEATVRRIPLPRHSSSRGVVPPSVIGSGASLRARLAQSRGRAEESARGVNSAGRTAKESGSVWTSVWTRACRLTF